MTACEIEVYAPGREEEPTLVPPGNLAYGADITGSEFTSTGADTGGWWGGYDRNDLSDMVSGVLNSDYWKAPRNNPDGLSGESVYVLVDLKEVKAVNTLKIWNYFKSNGQNLIYSTQILQLSENGQDWVNVYNSDIDNRTGQDPSDSGKLVCGGRLQNGEITGVPAGNDEAYEESYGGEGKTIYFDTQNARYIRWWCSGKIDNDLPQMVQIQAYYNHTVTFQYGNEEKIVRVGDGEMVSRPDDPISSELGRLFDCWTVGEVGGEVWDFSQPVTGDLTLVANWKTVPIHTVSFDTQGGSEVESVQVTEGVAITRPQDPEREGYLFAGWKCEGVPYRFIEPVMENITLTAAWVLPAEPDAFVIHAGLLDMTLDSHGQITNLVSTLDGKDYCCPGPDDRLRSLISLVADYQVETPTSLEYDEETGVLTFGFASIDTTAQVQLQDKGDYTSMTLIDVKRPEGVTLQAVLWGPIKNTITTGGQTVGTAYDDEYAIGLHMLNSKTIGGWPIEYKEEFYDPDLPNVNGYADPRVTRNIYSNTAAFSTWGSALQAYTWDYTQDTMRTIAYYSEIPQLQPAMTGKYADELASMIGSSVALYGTRPDNILNVISNIQLNEGLPHTTINGEWQKTSTETGQDFLVFNDAIWGNVANDAQMANAAGINYIYGQYGASGPWNGEGSYEFNGNFGGSDENAKAMAGEAAEYGVYIGTHTLSNLISYGTKYAQPEATDALSYAGFAALTRDISSTDTTIYVSDGFPFSDTVVGGSGGNRDVRIGGEMITFASCTQVSPDEWALSGCTRGSNGTLKTAHSAGENAYKLWYYYVGLVGGWDSLDPITTRMGTVFNTTGIHCMSYDSFESTKMSVYSSLLPNLYMKSVYNQVKEAGNADGFITEASDMDTNIWDVHSRISWGESNTPLNQMINYLSYYRQNFFPCMLGWMYDHGNHGGYSEPNLLMNLSMKGGWNAGAGWYVNRNTFNQYPHMAEMLKTWNNAIQKGAFVTGEAYTEEIQEAMRSAWTNGRVWTLTETVADQEWVLQEVSKADINQSIGEPVTLYAADKIKITQPENGDISTSTSTEYSRAHAGDVVTVYEQAFTGYRMVPGSLTVKAENGELCELTPVEGKNDAYTFVMPGGDVEITAEYVSDKQEPANKTLLQKTYEYAQTLSTEGVTDSAKAYFEKVMAEAKAVLEDESASQEEVDTAWNNLLEGIWGLGLVQGDKTLLGQLITKADDMIANENKYVQDNWQQLVNSLENANIVMADGDAMESDVQPAAEVLLEAILAQRYKADKSILEDLIAKAERVELSGYTVESVAIFTAAFQNAKAVFADESLSEDDQAVVDKAVSELQAAIENLSADMDNPSTDSEDMEKDDTNSADTPSENDSSQNEEVTNIPATGDSDVIYIWGCVGTLALMGSILAAKRRQIRKQ